nr:conjugal transfer protein TraN [Gammaproteobacteria bacterium]
LSKIAAFRLIQAGFDDWIRIVLNGHPVYIGPYGGDRLEVERVGRAGQRVRYTGAAHGPCELGTSWVKNLDIDLKPYLRSGENTLDLRVIVSGNGEGWLTLHATQYCGCQWAEHWRNDCGALEADTAQGRCARQSTVCTAPNQTRTFQGESVHRDCWQHATNYLCASGEVHEEPECQALRDRGCDQIGSACLSQLPDGRCAAYEQTYRCPERAPTTRTVLDCGHQTFCLEGDCFDAAFTPSTDFGLAASHLGTLDALAGDFDPEALRIFKGGRFNCAKSVAGFQNCCKATGWGVDIGLSQCDPEEKTLAEKRSAGLCHYVGSYCSAKVPVIGTCLEQKAARCCFTSKLARIIHEQGRAQLGIGWGDPEHPDCRGFTPEEIQSIDWEAIDFSEFYADALKQAEAGNRPSETELGARIKDRVTRRLP